MIKLHYVFEVIRYVHQTYRRNNKYYNNKYKMHVLTVHSYYYTSNFMSLQNDEKHRCKKYIEYIMILHSIIDSHINCKTTNNKNLEALNANLHFFFLLVISPAIMVGVNNMVFTVGRQHVYTFYKYESGGHPSGN